MAIKLKQGDVWLAKLKPSQIDGDAENIPILILQTQALLDINHPTTLVAILSKNIKENCQPLRIKIDAKDKLKEDHDVMIDKITAIDTDKILKGPLCSYDESVLTSIRNCVHELIDG